MNATTILETIVVIAGALMIPIAFIILLIRQEKLMKRLEQPLYVAKSPKNIELDVRNIYYSNEQQKSIIELRFKLKAFHVCIGRFHNGGSFANGCDMKKFTITHETECSVQLMKDCQSVLNSRYSTAFETLHLFHEYSVTSKSDTVDHNFKSDMSKYNFESTYLFLIQQADGSDEGFIGVNYNHTYCLTPEQRELVTEEIPRIRDLMNLTEGLLKIRKN